MVRTYLDFERPVAQLDSKIEALIASDGEAAEGVSTLRDKSRDELKKLYKKIGPWEKTQVCLLYTSPSPRDRQKSRMPSSA